MYVEKLSLSRQVAFCRVWGSSEPHDLHVHNCLEIGGMLKEELEYKFGDRTYRGRPGDVFLCRPFEPHWSFALPGQKFESILVLFYPSLLRQLPNGSQLLFPFYAKQDLPPLIPAHTTYANNIRFAAERAVEAQEKNTDFWMIRQYMLWIEIMLEIEKFAANYSPNIDIGFPRSSIAESVGFLLEHYRDALDTELLIFQSGMGKTLFFSEFRTLTGQTPNEFVNLLRVQNAMDLVRATELSMIQYCGIKWISIVKHIQ